MLTREQIKTLLLEFRERIASDAAYRKSLADQLNLDDAQTPFSRIIKLSLREAYANAYPSENFNAGKKCYEDGDISVTCFEARLLLLTEPDSPLSQYVAGLVGYTNHGLSRATAFLGLPNDRREVNSRQSFKEIGKNFIGYDEKGAFISNFFASIFYIIFNLTVFSIKVFISTFKVATEFIPYICKSFSNHLADKAIANITENTSSSLRILLYAAFSIATFSAFAWHLFYFFTRAITSPAKGVVSAAYEGGNIGDLIMQKRRSLLGDIIATVFTSLSLTMSVVAYLTLFPIKLTISFTTTVPFLARHLPAFIVKPIGYVVAKITPTLVRVGDALGKVLDPIVAPVAKALHENLTFMEVGLGGFAGLASAAGETSYTLFGSKILRGIAMGIVGGIVTAMTIGTGIISYFQHRRNGEAVEPLEEKKEEVKTTTRHILQALPLATHEEKKEMVTDVVNKVIPTESTHTQTLLPRKKINADSLNSTPPNYNHKQITRRIAPTQ